MPRVIAFHFIFSAYGFWLPNDPRGSWSDTVRRYELLAFGNATKTTSARSLAADRHDHASRLAAKQALKYPPVRFTGLQAKWIAMGFATACTEKNYRPLALAVLPDHAHLVLAWHPRHVDEIASHLKAKATATLSAAEHHPMSKYTDAKGRRPSPWARNYWCPFAFDADHAQRVIRYVENNPLKAGLPRQRWSFVQPFDPS